MTDEKEYENCEEDFFDCIEECPNYNRCFYRNVF